MNTEELLKLYKDYLAWKGMYAKVSFESFMDYIEKLYWLNKPTPQLPQQDTPGPLASKGVSKNARRKL